jgi:hypothetical protein
MRLMGAVVTIVYLLVGVIVAANHDYFVNLGGWREAISALLAVLLWPLVVLGIDMNIKGGGGGKAGVIAVPAGRAAAALGRRLVGRAT